MGNDRIDRVWLRLMQAYGSRVADSYGPKAPKPWAEAIDDLTDDQIAYGLRKVIRDTPIHPPTLGQFMSACADTPQAPVDGVSIQAQLCAYAMLTHFPSGKDDKFSADQMRQSSLTWTYLFREWTDENRPKHAQKCAECTGVLVPASGSLPGFQVTVADMLRDAQGHAKVMAGFSPAKRPVNTANWLVAQKLAADRMRLNDGDSP